MVHIYFCLFYFVIQSLAKGISHEFCEILFAFVFFFFFFLPLEKKYFQRMILEGGRQKSCQWYKRRKQQ